MAKQDKQGREYARLDQLKTGDVIETDDGFPCMAKGHHKVEEDTDGRLYVQCRDGHHYLSGQDDGDGYLVGMYKGVKRAGFGGASRQS